MLRILSVLAALALPLVVFAGELNVDPALEQARALRTAGDINASVDVLKKELTGVVETKGMATDAGATAQRALDEAANLSDVARKQGRLYYGLQEVKTAMVFTPILEAPLPQGFPPPGEVGQIVVKEYPAYRAARTSMTTTSDNNSAFGKLFRHISANDVKMTAPVEMTYERQTGTPISMAFLYEQPTLGTSRMDGEIEVVDLPAVTVVSVGVRGSYSDANRDEAVQKLRAWIESHKAEYEIAGEPRVMGYNSPFVLPMLRFSEVQIPVKKT